ncbi:MAG: hypothetical protein KDK36_02200 [Leptospiraceae bacterium]|nr:hypothetical protein [Leptospiraceae bacterium]
MIDSIKKVFLLSFKTVGENILVYVFPIIIFAVIISLGFFYSIELMSKEFLPVLINLDKSPDFPVEKLVLFFFYNSFIIFLFLFIIGVFNLYIVSLTGILLTKSHDDPYEAIGVTMKNLFSYFLLSILTSILTSFGFTFLFIPGIVLSVYFSMLAASLVIGNKGFGAMSDCFDVLKNRKFQTGVVYFLILCAFQIVGILISLSLDGEIIRKEILLIIQNESDPAKMIELIFNSFKFQSFLFVACFVMGIYQAAFGISSGIMYVIYKHER